MSEFTPENNETTLYIYCGSFGSASIAFDELLERAQDHFGQYIGWENLELTAEHIHTHCIGYDLYDSGDYTNYIVISKK